MGDQKRRDQTVDAHELARRIDEVCDAFERSWQEETNPTIEAYLNDWREPERSDLMRELLFVECQYRKRKGIDWTIEEFQRRFPSDATMVAEVLAELRDIDAIHSETKIYASTPDRTNPGDLTAGGRFGDYEILETIGSGGMGVVYRARQLSADRLVALKVVRADRLADLPQELRAEVVARFQREAKAAAAIEHDHLVTVYDVGEVDGRPYYSMQLIPGRSLADVVRAGPLEHRLAAGYIESVARAVQAAHAAGILHRDLKPHNILLDEQSGRALVADFGLAKLHESDIATTKTGDVFGSPPYMPPEQARSSGDVTVTADVYSLGATLYHLVTGRPPFQAATIVDTLRLVIEQPPVSPRVLNPTLDRDLETICLKCLEKNGDSRYQTAGDLAVDLRRFLEHRPIVARPIGPVQRTFRWCRRNRLATMVVFLLLILAIGGPIAAFQQKQLTDEASEQRDIATHQTQLAKSREQDAIRERKRVESELRHSSALRLATAAELARDQSPQLSVLLAVEAVRATKDDVEPVVPQARRALWDSLMSLQGEPVARFDVLKAGHNGYCEWEFSRNLRWLATGTLHGHIYLWDLHSSDPLQSKRLLYNHVGTIDQLAFTSDSKSLFVGTSNGVLLKFDLDHPDPSGTRRQLLALKQSSFRAMQISDDDRWLFAGDSQGVVRRWNLKSQALEKSVVELGRHKRYVHKLRLSHDCQFLVSSSSEKNDLRVWHDPCGPNPRPAMIAAFVGEARHVEISPDDTKMAIADNRGNVSLWDMQRSAPASKKPVQLLKSIDAPLEIVSATSLKFSPDSRWLVSGTADGRIHVWRLEARIASGQKNADAIPKHFILAEDREKISALAFTRDSRWLASSGKVIRLWNLESVARGDPYSKSRLQGMPATVTNLRISADSRELVACGADSEARRWTIESLYTPTAVRNHVLAMNKDGSLICTGPARRPIPRRFIRRKNGPHRKACAFEVWQRTGMVWARHIRGPEGQEYANSASFVPDSSLLLTRTYNVDDRKSRLLVWKTGPGKNTQPLHILKTSRSSIDRTLLWISRNRRWLIAGNSLYDLKSGSEVTPWTRKHTPKMVDRDGLFVVTNSYSPSETPRVWRIGSSQPAVDLPDKRQTLIPSRDGKWFATFKPLVNRGFQLWEFAGGNLQRRQKFLFPRKSYASGVIALQFSRDGRWVATTSNRRQAHLWRLTESGLSDRPIILPGTENGTRVVEFNHAGDRVAFSSGKDILIYELSSSGVRAGPIRLTGHSGFVRTLKFSRDGRWLITSGYEKAKPGLRLWDLTSESPADSMLVLPATGGIAVFVDIDGQPAVLLKSGSSIVRFDLGFKAWKRRAYDACRRNLSAAEWREYFGDRTYRPTLDMKHPANRNSQTK